MSSGTMAMPDRNGRAPEEAGPPRSAPIAMVPAKVVPPAHRRRRRSLGHRVALAAGAVVGAGAQPGGTPSVSLSARTPATGVARTPATRQLATASTDETARIWPL